MQRASLGHCGGKEGEAGASSPAQTVAWAGAARRLGGRRFGAQQLPLRTVRGPLSIPSCIQQKNLLRATRGLASVDLVRLAGPRPSLPRARSRSPAKPRQARPARPDGGRSPALQPSPPRGGFPTRVRAASRALGAARLKRSVASAAQCAQSSPARARACGSEATPAVRGSEPQRAQALAGERSVGPARDDECGSRLGQWVSAGPCGAEAGVSSCPVRSLESKRASPRPLPCSVPSPRRELSLPPCLALPTGRGGGRGGGRKGREGREQRRGSSGG